MRLLWKLTVFLCFASAGKVMVEVPLESAQAVYFAHVIALVYFGNLFLNKLQGNNGSREPGPSGVGQRCRR